MSTFFSSANCCRPSPLPAAVKGGHGRVGEAAVRHHSDGAAFFVGQIDHPAQALVVRPDAEAAVVHLHPGGEGGGGGRFVRARRNPASNWQRSATAGSDSIARRGVGAAGVEAGRGDPVGGQSFPDEEDDPEWFLHHPMAKIEKAEGDKDHQAKERQDLVTPFHSGDRASGGAPCQSRNRGKALEGRGARRENGPWQSRSCWSSATDGESIREEKRRRKKMATRPSSRARRSTIGSTANIRARP